MCKAASTFMSSKTKQVALVRGEGGLPPKMAFLIFLRPIIFKAKLYFTLMNSA